MRMDSRKSFQKRLTITADSMSVILDRQRANIVDSNTSKSCYLPCNFNCYVLTCCVNINAAAVYRLRKSIIICIVPCIVSAFQNICTGRINLMKQLRIIQHGSRICLRTRAIFLFFRPRSAANAPTGRTDSIMHTASAALRSLVLFFSCSLPLFVCYFAGTHPKRHRLLFKFTPPPYNISRGILLENRFEFLVELLKCLRFCPIFPGTFRSNENATQKSPLPLLGKGF